MIFSRAQEVRPLTEAQREEILDQRARASKIRGLNDHLEVILQKRVRLDIEIKKIEQKLHKLKSKKGYSEGVVQLSDLESGTTSSTGVPTEIQEVLNNELLRSDRLLREIEETYYPRTT